MTDNTDAVVPAVAPELKSTDTRIHVSDQPTKNELAQPSPPAEVKVEEKPEKAANTEAKGHEAALEGANDAPEADSPEKKEQRLPRWMKERLERVRQVTEAETRAKLLEELKSAPPVPAKPEKAPEAEQAKTLVDFDFDQDAYFDYKVELKLAQKEQAAQREVQAKEQAKAAEKFKARVDAFEEKAGAGAWEDITTSPLNTDPTLKPLVDMFLGEDHDLEIAHHLASNPDELTRIAALTPLARARELAKLADSFGEPAPAANIPAVPPKKTTNAPPPPKTVSGAGKGAIDVNSPNISSEDRIKAWRAGRK